MSWQRTASELEWTRFGLMRGLLAFVAVLALSGFAIAQDNVIFSEDFSTDGDGTRYTLEGRGIAGSPIRGFDHSFLIPTVEAGGTYTFPAARAAVPWAADVAALSDYSLTSIDSVVGWASGGRSGLDVALLAADNSLGGGDQALRNRLADQGHSVSVHAPAGFAAAATADLLFVSSSVNATDVLRSMDLRALDKPVLTANSHLASELLLTQGLGGVAQRESVQIRQAHPSLPVGSAVDSVQPLTTARSPLPTFGAARDGVNTLATYQAPFATQVNRLAVVDAMIDGRAASVVVEGTVTEADFFDSGGRGDALWDFDNAIPGGGGDDYAIVARGTVTIGEKGEYSFGLGGDDGGRLRINDQDVIVDDTTHGFQYRAATIELDQGDHQIEWVGFERGGGSAFELSVIPGRESQVTVDWDVLTTDPIFDEIGLKEPLEVKRYKLDAANSPLLPSNETAMVIAEAGAQTDVTHSPFRNDNGAYLLAGGFEDGGLEDPLEPRVISFPSVDLRGVSNPKLTIGLAGNVAAYDPLEVGMRILVNDSDLVEFEGDVFGTLNDGDKILTSSFKNLTYDLPKVDEAQVSIEIIAPDNDMLVGIDSIRISDGPIDGLEVFQAHRPNSFQQGVNGYSGTVDHEIWQEDPNDSHPDLNDVNDLEEILSLDPDGSPPIQVLIRFDDIFGEDGIPTDVPIKKATLGLEAFSRGDGLTLHRMLRAWDPSDSWNSLEGGVQADDVEAVADAESTSGDGKIEVGPVEFDVTESLQHFQANPDENFGWVLLPTGGDGNNLLSSETHIIPDQIVGIVNAAVGPLRQIVPDEQIAPILTFELGSKVEINIDTLCGAVAGMSGETAFDINGDGSVDLKDVDAFLAANGSLKGDANFNGHVAFNDFLQMAANFGDFPEDGHWSKGDFDCNGEVAFPDFLSLAANFDKRAGEASSVPEPTASVGLLIAGLIGLAWRRRGRRVIGG